MPLLMCVQEAMDMVAELDEPDFVREHGVHNPESEAGKAREKRREVRCHSTRNTVRCWIPP